MSWVTWEPKSTIRTLSCMDGRCAPKMADSGAQGPFGAAFCGLWARRSSVRDRGNPMLAPNVLRKCSRSHLFTTAKPRDAMAFETERMRLPAALRGRTDRRAKLFRESLGSMAQRH